MAVRGDKHNLASFGCEWHFPNLTHKLTHTCIYSPLVVVVTPSDLVKSILA